VRHAPLFAMVAAIGMAQILPHSPLADWLRRWELFAGPEERRETGKRKRSWLPLQAAIPIAVIGAIVALQALRVPALLAGTGWARLDPQVWPVELAPHLKRIEQESPHARVLNSLHFGGFVEFHAPGLQTYIDDRCELFGAEFLRRALALESLPSEMLAEAERWHARFALLHAGSAADVGFSENRSWRLLQRDAAAALYERRDQTD
jgi:hypothetical protein